MAIPRAGRRSGCARANLAEARGFASSDPGGWSGRMSMKLKLLAFAAAGTLAAFAGADRPLSAQPASGAGACALSLRAEVDGESFDMLEAPSGAARDRLVQQTGANFAAAA